MNKILRKTLDTILYIIVFFIIQFAVTQTVYAVNTIMNGLPLSVIIDQLTHGTFPINSKLLVAASVLSNLLTLIIFIKAKWAVVSRMWLATHPWTVLIWVSCLTLGTILPSQWLQELLNFTLPQEIEAQFKAIMGEPVGYLSIGILAPIAEELVFRGAVLRTLLTLVNKKWHWVAIIISAILFGAVHLNMPQFVHATLMGLLLGWMYYRTDSVIPGILFHWINNSIAYIMFNLMPQMADGKLIDLFHGDTRTMWMGIAFSMCIFVPSLLQLSYRLKKADQTR